MFVCFSFFHNRTNRYTQHIHLVELNTIEKKDTNKNKAKLTTAKVELFLFIEMPQVVISWIGTFTLMKTEAFS